MLNTVATPIYLHAITPIHSGTGSSSDVVDLPIAREKATGWPVIPGSSLKGVLAWEHEKLHGLEQRGAIYGTQRQRSTLAFTDMRILCMPVRSFFGTFAWVTSPLALDRYVRDARALGVLHDRDNLTPPSIEDGLDATVCTNSEIVRENRIYLEDLDLVSEPREATSKAAEFIARAVMGDEHWAGFVSRFAIVSNDIFDYICETATEVVARIALGDDGTTSGSGGNLWYEEAVPAEAIFAGFMLGVPGSGDGVVASGTVQIGGNAGVGRGLCRLVVDR